MRQIVMIAGCLLASALVLGQIRAETEPLLSVERVVSHESDTRSSRGFLRRILGKEDSRLFVRPYAIARIGDVYYVSDPGAGRVVRFSEAKAGYSASEDGVFASPVGLAACDGRLYVADSALGAVASVGSDLERVEWIVEGLQRPTGLACSEKALLIAETAAHRLRKLDGGVLTTFAEGRGDQPGEFNFPTLIAFAGTDVLVGDSMNFRIQRLDRSGHFLAEFGQLGDTPGTMPRLKGVAVDEKGLAWVSDGHLDQIAVYGAEGEFLLSIGGPGSEPGQFSFPAGLLAGSSQVVVVDSLNARVQFLSVRFGEARH